MSETCFDECVDISIALSLVSEGNVLKKLKIFTVVVNARYVQEGLLVKSAPFFLSNLHLFFLPKSCQICTFFLFNVKRMHIKLLILTDKWCRLPKYLLPLWDILRWMCILEWFDQVFGLKHWLLDFVGDSGLIGGLSWDVYWKD